MSEVYPQDKKTSATHKRRKDGLNQNIGAKGGGGEDGDGDEGEGRVKGG